MTPQPKVFTLALFLTSLLLACQPDELPEDAPFNNYPAVEATFAGRIDLAHLANYTNQAIPAYIRQDNSLGQVITNEGATLGRVLFYDPSLSVNDDVSCASCHQQRHGFSDLAIQSQGTQGLTGRHSMRLINASFAEEVRFFWDERAPSLEAQTTQPIQDHLEMGFSGENGDPDLAALIAKLEAKAYYEELFTFVYGDAIITEERLQDALGQFIRSIQSFDSKYDEGRAQVANDPAPFPNFTTQENLGKRLFIDPIPAGGAGCQGCHRAPEFDIDPASRNNGVIGVAGSPPETDLTNTRAPSLRDLLAPDGQPNGPFMHDGSLGSLAEVVAHYDAVDFNANLDPRLSRPGAQGQQLNLTTDEKAAIVAFLGTLTGQAVYTDEKWSDPF